jgi:hypothetical protein
MAPKVTVTIQINKYTLGEFIGDVYRIALRIFKIIRIVLHFLVGFFNRIIFISKKVLFIILYIEIGVIIIIFVVIPILLVISNSLVPK